MVILTNTSPEQGLLISDVHSLRSFTSVDHLPVLWKAVYTARYTLDTQVQVINCSVQTQKAPTVSFSGAGKGEEEEKGWGRWGKK